MTTLRLGHVQVAAPAGCEAAARRFYGEVLGLAEVEKPAVLQDRGGVWFQVGPQQLHIGVEKEFQPAKKAHPAFRTDELDQMAERVASAGAIVNWDSSVAGLRRFFTADPFGNRLEFIAG